MQDQIKEILSKEKISSSQFADKIGVQRSSVSHVLSGRNKPGFDFIQKILIAFPEINGEWLITGSGEMYKKKIPYGELFDQPMAAKPAEDAEKDKRLKTEVTKVIQEKEQQKAPQGREIEKIIVFYTDKTFREYHAKT